MKRTIVVFVSGVILLLTGCTDNPVTQQQFTPPNSVMTLDDFDDNNSQNVLGETFGQFKVDSMSDTGAVIEWGGGFWYAYASGNGGKVISSDSDTLIDSIGTLEDHPDMISKLMSNGALYLILNCQGCTGSYWAGIGCGIAGDYQNPYVWDTLENVGDNTVYWDFSGLDSVRIQMRGMGAILFFFESKAVKDKFPSPDEAWGFHGSSHNFGETMADNTSSYSFPVGDFVTTSPEAASVSWADASKKICGFVIELDTEKDDRLEVEIDKIEFFGLDTTTVFPFLK